MDPTGMDGTQLTYQNPAEALPSSLSDFACAHIRWRVLRGEFVSGAKIRELTLAKELDVSRAIIREATRRLSGAGLLEIDAQRGVFVQTYSLSQIQDIVDVRQALCGLTASLFVERATAADRAKIAALYSRTAEIKPEEYQESDYVAALAFNEEVVRAARNERLFSLYYESWQQVRIFKLHLLKNTFGLVDIQGYNKNLFTQGISQRARLNQAICEGSLSDISRAMRDAAENSLLRAQELFQQHEEANKTSWREKIISNKAPLRSTQLQDH